jgi:alpha-beta hydrolase superfamily lysophospholipase
MRRPLLSALFGGVVLAPAFAAEAPRAVSFATADGGTVSADVYGEQGRAAVVLAHGAVFDKGSWRALAEDLAARGSRVMAIDFRGYGRSKPGSTQDGLLEDVLAAVRWLRREGAPRVSVVGGSMGGKAAARAAAAAPGEIDRLILLSPAAIPDPERVRGAKLLVASVAEPGVERMRDAYERLPEPKRLVLLPGSAHGQHIFGTDQGARLTAVIVEFLAAPPPG